MIKFKSKSKRQKITVHNIDTHESFIEQADAKFKDILVNGVCLPSYQKFSQIKKKRQKRWLKSISLEQPKQKTNQFEEQQQKDQDSGLFTNSVIRKRLKSFQVQISITAKPATLERKYSLQRDLTTSHEQFIKTSNIRYHQPKSQRYISAYTGLNWSNTKNKTKNKHFNTQPTKYYSISNKTQNQSLHRPFLSNHNKNDHLQSFNDCLLAHCEKYLNLHNSEASKDIQFRLISYNQSNSFKSTSFKYSRNLGRTRNKVCYSIKLRNEHTLRIDLSQFENGKLSENQKLQ